MATRMTPQERRLSILDTAMDVVSEEGYKGLSLRELARRCGMSAPGVMHYFPDMPTLLLALLEHRDGIDGPHLYAVVAGSPDLRSALDAIVDYNACHPRRAQLYAMVQAEALDPAHPARAYFDGRTELLIREARSRVDTDAAPELLQVVPAVLDGLQLHWLMDPEGFDLRTQWAVVADALFAHYTRRPAVGTDT
ncbi:MULTISPECIES: TetR/AcrR family transcriptional regulator [unclassified Streptomyces]|uniref:TetR/AcrR family transcriptional regulator n=1 Tax=Streptomycetaceae TaxID=2062 RepID=UPI002E76C821|nr:MULTISPECIES: TetR/AcrR family transcriptional regulator [unclassified Streptomyces]MED7951055.1 TetR/AcrR family transcriptional regulator [Streptomyces sp. BE303]MEE1821520.1 TetR/AcrR family transcriptional regulator [Streptomyces sp. BE20]